MSGTLRTTDVRDVATLLDRMNRGARPKFLFFWGHRPPKDGRITASCFSQWFEAPFVTNGTRYRTAEHFMMAEEARLFGDLPLREHVLACATPAEAKTLGRRVAGFDEATWARERFGIVVEANRGKFESDPALREFLVNTGDRVLVEASPVDPVWGIGLAADHDDAARPQRWQGLNLLGFALMEVRSLLSAQRQGEPR